MDTSLSLWIGCQPLHIVKRVCLFCYSGERYCLFRSPRHRRGINDILFKTNGSELTVIPEGRIDTNTAPVLEQLMAQQVSGINSILFDLEKINYIFSAGLRVLLYYAQQMEEIDGTIKAIHVSDEIRKIFDMTGFLDILHVDD